MTSISDKQLQILECIHQSIETNGYPPTVREIGASVGLSSTSTVHGHLSRLEKNEVITRNASKTRAIELTELGFKALGINPNEGIPLLGRVAAGAPILAVEEAVDFYPVPPHLTSQTNDLFMLEISGESMINAGIMDGDLITVRRQPTANNGEIVIALTNEDEATCKTYYRQDHFHVLRPENDTMDDIVVDDVTILGKVISLYRQI